MKARALAALGVAAGTLPACSAQHHRENADRAAYRIIEEKQRGGLGRTEPFTVDRPSDAFRRRLLEAQGLPVSDRASLGTDALAPIRHWPNDDYLASRPRENPPAPPWAATAGTAPVTLTLPLALQVGARNSRPYQDQKETVFQTALALDLERDVFRNTFFGTLDAGVTRDLTGVPNTSASEGITAGVARQFKNGAALSARIGLDLAQLLSGDRVSALGVFGDASVSIPLLRGAGRDIVTEPLTQAERDVTYAIFRFERFKKSFAVQVASGYLNVLEQGQRAENSEASYRRLITSARRARRLADAGRLPDIQVDQALQSELRARDRWIASVNAYDSALDSFKLTLGLPPDAAIRLDPAELDRLAAGDLAVAAAAAATQPVGPIPPADAPVEIQPPSREGAGPYEFDERFAIDYALQNRLDLRIARGQVFDAERKVVVAADALGAGLNLLGTAAVGGSRGVGSAALADASPRFDRGRYSALLTLDLPLERTRERNAYRLTYVALEKAVRDLQQVEDQIKLDLRNDVGDLVEFRESLRIQAESVALAERRVASTNLFLEAGRAQIRDVLEAQEALITAQNALAGALVDYRVTELSTQRDMELLEVDHDGLVREKVPQTQP